MRSCKEVARLISLSQEQKLSLSQRMELKLHFSLCNKCKRLDDNMKTLRKALKQFSEGQHEENQKDK